MFVEIVDRHDTRHWLSVAHIVSITQDTDQAQSGIIELAMSNGDEFITNDYDPMLHGMIGK